MGSITLWATCVGASHSPSPVCLHPSPAASDVQTPVGNKDNSQAPSGRMSLTGSKQGPGPHRGQHHTMLQSHSKVHGPINFLSCLMDSRDTFSLPWPYRGRVLGELCGSAMLLFISWCPHEMFVPAQGQGNPRQQALKAAWEGTRSAFRTSTNQVINHC